MAAEPDPRTPDRTPYIRDEIETVRVRRSPKYGVFLGLGAGLGILLALILTFSFAGTDQISPNTGMRYGVMQVFGFLALICVSIGVVVAGAVALILDRIVGRRIRSVRADHKQVHLHD